MRNWSERVIEEANLLNPAFGAVLLAEAVAHFDDKAHRGFPFALTFLVLPIVLHENTRKSLPRTTLTALLPWVQEHRETLVGFSERVAQLQAVSREALLFGLQTDVLRVDEQGLVRIGDRRKTVTAKRAPYFTDEVTECVDRSGFLGRWFCGGRPDYEHLFCMERSTMSLQIRKVVLYSKRGAIRELPLEIGRLNIITGASKTGKSALVDIVDYCTGRGECLVPEGKIREHVGWYGVLFQLGDGQIFVARRNPALGEKSHPDVFLLRGSSIDTPAMDSLVKNTTVDGLEKFLGGVLGISENEHRPVGFTRPPLEATFRHALLLCVQDQNDIDSKQRLFHRQGEDFMGTAIRDTLPYFLGAYDEEHLLKQSQLDQARRELRILERELRDVEAVDTSTFPRARALMEEAKAVGLLADRTPSSTYEAVITLLRSIAEESRWQDELVISDEADLLSQMRAERQGLRTELEQINAEIRSTRNFTTETRGYEREAKEQRARLSSVGLIVREDAGHAECPVCKSHLSEPVPTVQQIDEALQSLSLQLEAVEAENPRLLQRLANLEQQAALVQERLQDNQSRIATRVRENELMKSQQDTYVLQARTIGKISQYVESVNSADASSSLRSKVDMARNRVAILEQELDPESAEERLATFLNLVAHYMTDYSERLDLEHRGSQLRLDIRALTVVADTVNGPVPLSRMGSGENWVGYHVLAHLALHKWFRQKERPVPGFLFLDQPSQAHYPPEKDANGAIEGLKDEDQTAVLSLFKLIYDAATEMTPGMQIIVTDHADLKSDWFSSSVVARWRGHEKLVPEEWYTESGSPDTAGKKA